MTDDQTTPGPAETAAGEIEKELGTFRAELAALMTQAGRVIDSLGRLRHLIVGAGGVLAGAALAQIEGFWDAISGLFGGP